MRRSIYSPLFNSCCRHETARDELYNKLYHLPNACHLDIPISSFRSGTSYPAFFYPSEDIDNALERIGKLKKELAERSQEMTDKKRNHILRSFLKEEIRNSAALEGMVCSDAALRSAENAFRKGGTPVPFSGIIRAYEQLIEGKDFSFDTCENIRAFYNDFILNDILQNEPENAPDGDIFRREQVEISYGNRVRHEGVYPEPLILEYMEKALKLKNSADYPVLVRHSAFHFLFVYIYPFYSGTGLVSRFIISCCMAKEISPFAALLLSSVLREDPGYNFRLYKTTCAPANRGCLTGFIVGFLEIMEMAAEKALEEI